VNIRIAVSAATGEGRLDPAIPASAAVEPAGVRRLAGMGVVPVFRRDALAAGQAIRGPALVEDGMSTLVVPTGAVATLEANGNLVMELPA
jgi:N-methylhydantoinase A